MLIKKEINTFQDHIKLLFTWVQNPLCSTLLLDFNHIPTSKPSLWRPRKRFMEWALRKENLQQGFAPYFHRISLSNAKQNEDTLEGNYTLDSVVEFSTPFATLHISPDATIIHNNQKKIIEVCCQPDRKGNTNQYALQKSRLRAAIYSYALHPQAPCPSAFIVLHRWSHLVIHEQNIEQELQQIHEAIHTSHRKPYHFMPSCRWFCRHSKTCQGRAQDEGLPVAWSPSLQNIVHSNVWAAKEESSEPKSSPLKTIAHFYKKSFSEQT